MKSKINGNRGFFTKGITKNFIKVEFLKKKIQSTKLRLMKQLIARSYKLHTHRAVYMTVTRPNTKSSSI